jgi:hypothetical protein
MHHEQQVNIDLIWLMLVVVLKKAELPYPLSCTCIVMHAEAAARKYAVLEATASTRSTIKVTLVCQ